MTAMMGCPICNSMRLWRDWPGFSDEPIEEELYTNAEAINLEWPGFSARERLLLEFVDRFANAIDGMNGDDAFWERMHANFSDTEIGDVVRSEEHTSELQSLMRISYAVFCLQKTKKK